MPISKQVGAQRDFTAGELDPTAKRRDDDDFMKKGMRQLSNARTLNTGGVTNRPGRNLVASRAAQSRDEDVLMAPGVTYRLSFTNATLKIYNSAGTQVFTEGGRAWTGATLGQIVFAVYLKQVFITYPGVVPEVLTWDGVVSWTTASYAELVGPGGQKRTAFYRIARKGIQLSASATTGAVNVTLDANYFTAAMVGTRVRYIGRQILLTAWSSPTLMAGLVIEPLPGSQFINFAIDPTGIFNLGDIVLGTVSGAQGYIVTLDAPGMRIGIQLMSAAASGVQSPATAQDAFGRDNVTQTGSFGFVATDRVVGPGGAIAATAAGAISTPNPVPFWDEEVMNASNGWPASCFVDQNRVGFDNFPSVPAGIGWSAIGSPFDLYPDAFPVSAIFELAPGKMRVQHVIPGPDGSEIVFCDNGVFYIPISPTNPLKPGSVQFLSISGEGAAGQVQPRRAGNAIVFADGGLNMLQAIVATGAYSRPFEIENLTDLHAHLFNNIQAIALPTSVTQFPERYAYVLNGDGTMALGKYVLDKDARLAGKIGWLPWNGAGVVKWISALNDVVLFVTAYTQGGTTAFMVEQLDATRYLDASLPVNAIPAALTPPGGKGPLWWLPLATVDLMDGRLALGPHATDANGFILPIDPGEDLTSASLRAGFTWTATWEPFMPAAPPGQDAGQRMKKRRAHLQAYVINSSGFRFAKLASGEIGPNLPALGTIVSDRRFPAYNQGDDATKAPPLREQAYRYNPLGRSHDPRNAIIKDTPGPLTLVELTARISV